MTAVQLAPLQAEYDNMLRCIRCAICPDDRGHGAAIRLGGTLSGEHGIGRLKREFLEEAQGPLAVALSRSIKRALDPDELLGGSGLTKH